MHRLSVWTLAAAGLLLPARLAQAQIIYEFANGTTGAAQSSFTVPAGGTIPISVYIHETATGAPTLNSQGGLGTAAVRVTFNSPAGVAAVQTTADIVSPVPPWDLATPTIGSGANANTAALTVGKLVAPGVLPNTQGRVLLGTFTLHALTSGTVNLSAVNPNSAGYNTSSFNATGGVPNINYDPLLQPGAATLTVSPVPEPGSLVLAGLAAVGLAAARRRRAKTPVSAARA
jgi:hypothetical protein